MKNHHLPKSNTLHLEYLTIAALKPYPHNARTHSKKQLQQIADSIQQFGFTNPILLDHDNVIIAGHGRVIAAKQLGFDEVPIIRLEHLTDDEKRAYIIADNRLAELAGWDESVLAIELQNLLNIDLNFDVAITGFDMPKIDYLIQKAATTQPEEEEITPVDDKAVITKSGDLWQLGNHRILCGDALNDADYHMLMQEEKAQIVFTDPPYNVPIDGHSSGLGKVKHQDFAMASGEMASEEFAGFLRTTFQHLTRHARDGSIHYVCMDWRHIPELLAASRPVYAELKNLCVWNKDNGGMGSLYRSKHELIFVFKQGNAVHINNVELGAHGRHRTNVWDYPGLSSLHPGRDTELAMHPTVKPVAMVADALLDCSRRNGLVLDPFGGSGTTLIAAEKTGRKARLMEIAPCYVDVTIRRWEKLTGVQAVHTKSGQTFEARSREVTHAE